MTSTYNVFYQSIWYTCICIKWIRILTLNVSLRSATKLSQRFQFVAGVGQGVGNTFRSPLAHGSCSLCALGPFFPPWTTFPRGLLFRQADLSFRGGRLPAAPWQVSSALFSLSSVFPQFHQTGWVLLVPAPGVITARGTPGSPYGAGGPLEFWPVAVCRVLVFFYLNLAWSFPVEHLGCVLKINSQVSVGTFKEFHLLCKVVILFFWIWALSF